MMLKLSGKLPVFLANLMMMKGGREGGVREANGRAVVGASKQASTHFPRNIHQLLFIFSLSLSSPVHLPTVPLQLLLSPSLRSTPHHIHLLSTSDF